MTKKLPQSPKHLVARSYDQIAEQDAKWSGHIRAAEREHYTQILLRRLPKGAEVLELGCGTGTTTARLSEHCRVTAVDISQRCIAIARQNVPSALFICADMTALDYPESSFDAVAAFYSIIHVPRQEHAELLLAIARWLRPTGLFMATMGTDATEAGYEEDWFGAPMYWSSFDSQTNRRLVEEAGFEILRAREETAEEDTRPTTFLWIVAQKPDA